MLVIGFGRRTRTEFRVAVFEYISTIKGKDKEIRK